MGVDRNDREVRLQAIRISITACFRPEPSCINPRLFRPKSFPLPDRRWKRLELQNQLLSFARRLSPCRASVLSSIVCWRSQTQHQPQTTSSPGSHHTAISPPPTAPPSSSSPFCRSGVTLENSWLVMIHSTCGIHGIITLTPSWLRNIVPRMSWRSGRTSCGYQGTTPTLMRYFGPCFLSERTGVPASVVRFYSLNLGLRKTQR